MSGALQLHECTRKCTQQLRFVAHNCASSDEQVVAINRQVTKVDTAMTTTTTRKRARAIKLNYKYEVVLVKPTFRTKRDNSISPRSSLPGTKFLILLVIYFTRTRRVRGSQPDEIFSEHGETNFS